MTGRRTGLLMLVAVVFNALVQGLLLLGNPTPSLSVIFVLGALVSALLWLGTYAIVVAGTLQQRITGRFVAWTVLLWLVVILGLIPFNGILGLLILAATPYLPLAAMADAGNPVSANFRTIGRAPLRYVWRIIVFALLALLAWLLLALNAFFVGGFVAAAANSLAIGLVGWLVTWSFARVYRAEDRQAGA